MAFTKINAAGIGSTETVTVDGLTVINNGSFGGTLSVGGTLTYEDVTNVDAVGLITARNGIVVGSGITLSKDGDIFATGISTFSEGIAGDLLIDDKIVHRGDTNTAIRFPENDHISFETTGSEAIRIDNGGKLLIGLTTRRLFTSGVTSQLQIEGTNANLTSSLSIVNNQNDGKSANIRLGKTRGTSVGSNTSVADGDKLGEIVFYGS